MKDCDVQNETFPNLLTESGACSSVCQESPVFNVITPKMSPLIGDRNQLDVLRRVCHEVTKEQLNSIYCPLFLSEVNFPTPLSLLRPCSDKSVWIVTLQNSQHRSGPSHHTTLTTDTVVGDREQPQYQVPGGSSLSPAPSTPGLMLCLADFDLCFMFQKVWITYISTAHPVRNESCST